MSIITQFEALANELLLDLFEYFDTLHLLGAFSSLNYRFDTLLYKHFRAYHLDLRRICKQDFNILCQQHFPLIINNIVSVHLAGYNEPPGLLQLFLSRGFILDQFLHLQSLSLYRIKYTDIIKLLGESHRLVHLYRLNIIQCNMSIIPQDTSYSINQIWNLPKLTHLNLERFYLPEVQFSRLTVTSDTLQHLSIQTVLGCPFSDLVNIFQCTPRLRFLSICIDLQDEEEQFPIVFTPIITLKLEIYVGTRTLNSFLQNLPNLRHLTVHIFDNYLNGHEWKQIIVKHLPNLKVLRFKMLIHGLTNHNMDEQVDELLETFRTLFWLDEHHWYVRCDWDSDRISSYGNLYTVPYAFHLFGDTDYRRSKWTCPDDKKYCSFDHVHSLIINRSIKQPFNIHSSCFSNIHDIKIRVPLPDKIWSIIPTFDHLTSLTVSIYEENDLFDLQLLLDKTTRLYTLSVEHQNASALRLISKLTSASIRQLVFLPSISPDQLFFDDADCAAFARSSLAHQCEVLEIYVRSQAGVVYLVHTMVNLRAMIIYVCDDENVDVESSQVRRTRYSFVKGKLNFVRRELSLLWKRLSTRKRKSHTTRKDFPEEKSPASLDIPFSTFSTQMEHELIEWLQNTLQTRCWISCSSGWTDYFYLKCWIG
jgi:hypothetical protein